MKIGGGLFNFSALSKRKKITTLIALALLLIVSGTFLTLLKMGKLRIGADIVNPNLKTVNASGITTDASTGQPLPGVTVSLGYWGSQPVTTTTDTNGSYNISMAVDSTIPNQQSVGVQFQKDEYSTGETDNIQKMISPTDPNTINFSQNFALVPKPDLLQPNQDYTPSSTQSGTTNYTPSSTQSGTTVQNGEVSSKNCYFNSTYGEYIGGILYCTRRKDLFLTNHAKIVENAKQVSLTLKQVGIPVPGFYLYDYDQSWQYKWGSDPDLQGAGGFFQHNGYYNDNDPNAIFLSYNFLNYADVYVHEIGHYVDWQNGYTNSNSTYGELNDGCEYTFKKGPTYIYHCFSSSYKDFRYANNIASVIMTKKFNTTPDNYKEMYANIFELQLNPDKNFTARQKLQYAITNSILSGGQYGADKLEDGEISPLIFYPTGTLESQNASMYLYKFVAKGSKLPEYFPGTIKHTWTYNEIWYGKYMTTGVVPVRVTDHAGAGMENTMVAIGKQLVGIKTGATRLKKETGVFGDNSGDLFNTTGTVVLMNVSLGGQSFDIPSAPSYYKGAIFLPIGKSIIQGANPVIDLSYSLQKSGPYWYSDLNPQGHQSQESAISASGTITLVTQVFSIGGNKTIRPIVKNDMTRYPTLGTVGGRVDSYGIRNGVPVIDQGYVDVRTGYLYYVVGGNLSTKINEEYSFGALKISNTGVVTKPPRIINSNNTVSGIGCGGYRDPILFGYACFARQYTKSYNACIYSSTSN